MRKFFLVVLFLLSAWMMRAEVIPHSPPHYFNDFASVVSDETIEQLDKKLEQLEKETTAQVVVAIYPKMQTESSIEDYTLRVAEKWGVGQKGKDNGAVLFVFIQDRKMFLQVGYGLEEKIPDALAKQIIEYQIKPAFKNGDYDLGLKSGVDAICEAINGNYQIDLRESTTKNVVNLDIKKIILSLFTTLGLFLLFIIFLIWLANKITSTKWYKSLPHSSSSSSSSWSSSSSSGSSFSGGGGHFGGGGAGGSW
ncbi:MAG: TPM domain-containing protein [Verrucomicrobiae bacterium]|nr:TPM domain-containing protein [Verrucomicrobiae bacterium]